MKNAAIKTSSRAIHVVLAIAGLTIFTTPASRAADGLPVVNAETAAVTGFILYSDGETPATRRPVRVWDIDKEKFVFETESDDFGMYRIPKLERGQYTIYYDRVRTHMNILDSETVTSLHSHNIIVVLPVNIGSVSFFQMQTILFNGGLVSSAPVLARINDNPPDPIRRVPPDPPSKPPPPPPPPDPPIITPPDPPPVVSP